MGKFLLCFCFVFLIFVNKIEIGLISFKIKVLMIYKDLFIYLRLSVFSGKILFRILEFIFLFKIFIYSIVFKFSC